MVAFILIPRAARYRFARPERQTGVTQCGRLLILLLLSSSVPRPSQPVWPASAPCGFRSNQRRWNGRVVVVVVVGHERVVVVVVVGQVLARLLLGRRLLLLLLLLVVLLGGDGLLLVVRAGRNQCNLLLGRRGTLLAGGGGGGQSAGSGRLLPLGGANDRRLSSLAAGAKGRH